MAVSPGTALGSHRNASAGRRNRVKVGMLLDNPFTSDQRVHRAARSLARSGFGVTLLAFQAPGLPEAETVDGIRIGRVFTPAILDVKRPAYLRSHARRWAAEGFDVLHCHDHWMLHLGVQIKRLRPETVLIYDSHELFHGWPLNLASDLSWFTALKSVVMRKYLIRRERADSRDVDHLITVNESLAERLREYFDLRMPPVVIRNVPDFETCEVGSQPIREVFDIPPDARILVFIGASLHARTRNLEAVIDEFGDVRGTALVFISGEGSTTKEVVAYAKRRRYANIFFHPRIAPQQITRYLASCDVGLVPTWNRSDLSYWLALDNKLFHYVMAELPVLATRQPEYRKVVERYDVGVCVNPDTPGAYLDGFRKIIASYPRFKENARRAKLRLNWEREEAILLDLYRQVEQAIRLGAVSALSGGGRPGGATMITGA